jgi:hypothetical protein
VTISPSQARDRALKGQAALSRKWLELAGGDQALADQLKREHFRSMHRKSLAKRRAKRARQVAESASALGIATTEDELLALARAQRKTSEDGEVFSRKLS